MDPKKDIDRGVRQRPLAVGDIQYYYIPLARPKRIFGIFPPKDFDLPVLELIRVLPRNLTQLNDPFIFYGDNRSIGAVTPHRFVIFYPEDIQLLISKDPYKSNLKIFIVNPLIPNLTEIVKKLDEAFSLIYFINGKEPEMPIKGLEDRFFVGHKDMMKKLAEKKTAIEKVLLEEFPQRQIEFVINLPVTEHHVKINPQNSFRASHTNFWTLNQILGNSWNTEDLLSTEEAIEDSKMSLNKDPSDPYRLQILVDQVKQFDELEIIVSEDRGTKFPNGKADWFAPLVLILPFNFPSLSKVLDPSLSPGEFKRLSRIMNVEQKINYLSYSSLNDTTEEDLKGYAGFVASKTQFMDGVAYLHASFQNSPVVRFPTLGNSIKRELSFFKPETINDKKWDNSKELIDTFGNKLKSLILPNAIDEELFLIPRQIVAISDLPIEWVIYKDANLYLSRDITRLPETPYGGILASYSFHSNFMMTISESVLSDTLVLLGASNDPEEDKLMKIHFRQIEKLSQKLGFRTFHCSSVEDVITQVETHKPQLLIFDAHGGFDPDTLSSFLWINDKKITSQDIVKHKISAPLVFLSACHTNPNYGYLGKIADAFFEVGCLAITATYFPVSIASATTIYLRLLNNLSYASRKAIHKNWLEFVSHVIRTSIFKDTLSKTRENVMTCNYKAKEKLSILSKIRKLDLDISLKFLRNEDRPKILANFLDSLRQVCPEPLIEKTVVSEAPFYTNMGRPDLIRFKAWDNEFYELNNIRGEYVKRLMS